LLGQPLVVFADRGHLRAPATCARNPHRPEIPPRWDCAWTTRHNGSVDQLADFAAGPFAVVDFPRAGRRRRVSRHSASASGSTVRRQRSMGELTRARIRQVTDPIDQPGGLLAALCRRGLRRRSDRPGLPAVFEVDRPCP